jgi:hypothetical protein
MKAEIVNKKKSSNSQKNYRNLEISRLHLDSKNARHDPLSTDAEVITQLCSNEKIEELAEDIAMRGALSPLDVLGVIPYEGHPGHFIAVEGNRRTCALILLADPSRAPTTHLRSRFEKIANAAKPLKEVGVHVFLNREESKQWIDLRHLGEQGGIGTREWDSDQKTRAAGGNTKTTASANSLALKVIDRLEELNYLTPQQREKVKLTTIARYLSTPGVRAILGLSSKSNLMYSHDVDEVDNALAQLVLDSIEPKEDGSLIVTSRSNSADRLKYVAELSAKGIAPVTPIPEPKEPPKIPAEYKVESPRLKKLSARNPTLLPTLFNSSFVVASRDPVLLRLRKEALNLQLDDFPFGGNYLLRAFIEQTMVLFAKKKGKYNSNMKDQKLTEVCANELKDMGVSGKALSVLKKAAGDENCTYSLHSLGHVVHGGSIPTRLSLRANFDTWVPALRAMLDAL